MDMQLSLFDQGLTIPVAVQFNSDITVLQDVMAPLRKTNYRKGVGQTVSSIKRQEDLIAMASWLYSNADRKYFLCFTLGINLGLRANELLKLKHSDIFFPSGEIRYVSEDCSDTTDKMSVYQSKTDKRRGIYLNSSCAKVLDWYFPVKSPALYSDNYLFPSREGGHIEVGTLRKVLKRAAKACGLKQDIGTHSLRKTFGYFHYQRNHDIVFLQRLFGHSSALITMRYIGIADEEEKKAYHEVSIDLMGALEPNPVLMNGRTTSNQLLPAIGM